MHHISHAATIVISGLFISIAANAATVREQAAAAGLKTCLSALEQVETYLTGKQASDSVVFQNNAAVDRNLFSALMALEGSDNNSIASLNVTPSTNGMCVVEYTQSGYNAQSCVEYIKPMMNHIRFLRDLGKRTSLFQGQGLVFLLTNAGSGCLWVRKELIEFPQARSAQPAPTATPQTPAPPQKRK